MVSRTSANWPHLDILSFVEPRWILLLEKALRFCILSAENTLCSFISLQRSRLWRCSLSYFRGLIEPFDPSEDFGIPLIRNQTLRKCVSETVEPMEYPDR